MLCSICRNYELNQLINGWIRSGVPDQQIALRLAGTPQSKNRKTIGIHRNQHLRTEVQQERSAQIEALKKQQRAGDGSPPITKGDFAAAIVENVHGRLIAGELEPTISDALKATTIIDARDKAGADRDFMLQLAQALGGALVIEGQYRDVTPGALADEAEFARLTAG